MLMIENTIALKKVHQTDYYLKHLASFSDSKAVKNHSDILNESGGILIPLNTTLTPKLILKLMEHSLAMPIEFSVEITQTLNSEVLMALYEKVVLSNSAFKSVTNNLDINDTLKDACVYMEQFPVLYQKLAVLQFCFPDKFIQAIISGYMCLSLSKKMGEKKPANIYAFVAGLIHDFSMMSLDLNLLKDDVDYTSEQWRAMHDHCIIGFEHLCIIDGFPTEITQAVLDHHEHADGSGYPYGKTAKELSVTAQIVTIVDACLGIYQRESSIEQLGVDSLIPVLEMNSAMYIPCVYSAATDLLSSIPCELRRVYSNQNMPTVISGLMLDNEEIQHDYCILYGLVTCVKPHIDNQALPSSLLSMAARINKSLIASGLLKNEHNEWMVISCGAQQEYDYIAIENLEVIYGEIRWQIKQLSHLVSLLLSDQLISEQTQINKVERGLLAIAQYHQDNKHISVAH
jgi:hypothetical protein